MQLIMSRIPSSEDYAPRNVFCNENITWRPIVCLKNYVLHINYLHRVYGGETFGLQEIGLQYF